jgi:hypothetical protein
VDEGRDRRGGADGGCPAADGSPTAAEALASARRLHEWLEAHEYAAYDPFDGLASWARPLARGKTTRQVLQKSVRMAPVNLRPLLGVKPARSTKALGYCARAYLKLERLEPAAGWGERAVRALEWLLANASPGYSGLAWGNHFDYQSRLFYLPQGEPTVVWTALIGHAFVDAWEDQRERRWLDAARSVRDFIMQDLERREMGAGLCISYVPSGFTAVHNSNVLAAGLLARIATHTGDAEALEVARRAVDYTVGCQRPDGTWWYGEAEDRHWVDSFHTGYVLDSLWWYMVGSGDDRHADSFVRGARSFVEGFFTDDGLPKYYRDRWWPADIQCAAQGIESLALLARLLDPGIMAVAERVADWTIATMQQPDGHFAYQLWPGGVLNRTAMLHWGQATMLHALASLVTEERGDG